MKDPTLRDVAKAAGFSLAAVSMALRGDARIHPSSRDKILAAARRLGYKRSPTLSALAARRWPRRSRPGGATVAVVAIGIEQDRIDLKPKYFGEPEIVAAVRARAADLGYRCECHRVQDYPSAAALKRILLARGIEGLLLTGGFRLSSIPDTFFEDFACVLVGMSFTHPFVSEVATDLGAGVRIAAQEALKAGYRRPGFVLYPYALREKRELILSHALMELHALARRWEETPAILELPEPLPEARLAFQAWLARERPDVVISSNNNPLDWMPPARRRGRRPGFVSLFNQGILFRPGIAHVSRHHREEGVQAVELLDHLLRHRLKGLPAYPTVVNIPPEWVGGATLPPRAG